MGLKEQKLELNPTGKRNSAIKTRTKKLERTLWGRQFIQGMESFTEASAMARGRRYLENHSVLKFSISENLVEASFREGVSRIPGFMDTTESHVKIEFTRIPPIVWKQFAHYIGNRARCVARLLLKEMPEDIEEPLAKFDLNLIPRKSSHLSINCSCTQQANILNPCRHITGVYYVLADRIAKEPLMLVELRGLSKSELLDDLTETPLGHLLKPVLVEEHPDIRPVSSFFTRPEKIQDSSIDNGLDFWDSKAEIGNSTKYLNRTAEPLSMLKMGGDYPSFWNREESFIEVMDELYQQMAKADID